MRKKRKKFSLCRDFMRDFIWVFRAFWRGAVLGKIDYQPQGDRFLLPINATTKRIKMLMKWWGYPPFEKIDKLHSLIKLQKNGKFGLLLTNGKGNIFFFRDKHGVHVIGTYWNDEDGWNIIRPPMSSYKWHAGDQILLPKYSC
jgi:hypothetical protein